jgi:hypothetical protein
MEPEQSAQAPTSELPPFPEFTEPMQEHAPVKMTWAEAWEYFAPLRNYYMRHYDSPERRLADKNPERFRID